VHTPRLCIDARAAAEYPEKALINQEVIDQLVAAFGEQEASEWIEKRRTVLLSHPNQIFSGQLKRYDTRKKIGRGPLYWLWERNFVRNAHISVFHRFRPIDRVTPTHGLPSLTTVLPARKKLPFFLPTKGEHHYAVPSEADATTLEKQFQVPKEKIAIVTPSVRRYLTQMEIPKPSVEGQILILIGGQTPAPELARLRQVLSQRFVNLRHKLVYLHKQRDLTPATWLKWISQTQLCVYLADPAFDWGTLALEAIYCGVPTIFPDTHRVLGPALAKSPLTLSQFLIELADLPALKKATQAARQTLETNGTFQPLQMAKQYKVIYGRIGIPREVVEAVVPREAPCQEYTPA
jgi:hypothetical protein